MRLRRGLRAFGGGFLRWGRWAEVFIEDEVFDEVVCIVCVGSEEMESRLEELESRLGSRQT